MTADPPRRYTFLAILTSCTVALSTACHSSIEPAPRDAAAEVAARLAAHGQAAVIVSLVEPPGYGDPARAPEVRAAIARMQAEVLATLDPADFQPRLRYTSIPAFAGIVHSAHGLERLLSHGHVRAVSLDLEGGGTR